MDLKDHEARLPDGLLSGLSSDDERAWLGLLERAAYRTRTMSSGGVAISRSRTKKPILIEALKNKEGDFVGDVDRLTTGPLDPKEAVETRKRIKEGLVKLGVNMFPTNLSAAMVGFWTEPDPMTPVKMLDDQYGGLCFYRLRARQEWAHAEVLWRLLLVAIDEDVTLGEIRRAGEMPPPDVATSLMSLYPSLLVTVPLVGRMQPLAATFMTSNAAEIVALPPSGAWTRHPHLDPFPVSLGGRIDLLGPGEGAHRTSFETIPEEWGEPMLMAMVRGASEAVAVLNDPAMWRDPDGFASPVERAIAEATIRVGLDAVNGLGADWGGREDIWTAFRSLGALAGMWEAGTNQSLLPYLLNPEIARQSAIPANVPDSYQRWCAEVLDSYESELAKLFPGEDKRSATAKLVEIRNLVHGVGAIPTKKRDRRSRFDVMRRVGAGALVHLRDLSTMWWTSAIQSPREYIRPGAPPFRT